MNLKSKLQRMLQIVEDAERVGALADIERDILLAELREAYTELKFGETENGELKTESERCAAEESVADESVAEESAADESVADESVADESVADESVAEELPITPIIPIAPITPMTDESAEEDEADEPEVEVELIFNEEDEETENEELKTENEEIAESNEEVAESNEEIVEPNEVVAEDQNLSTLNPQSSIKKRSALLSLYEDAPAPVLGEQFHEAPSVADTIACPKGVAESAPVASLREAIGLADKFMLIRELFDGEAEAYDKAIEVLDKQPSFDDCIIYIAENYTWSPNSAATKFLMELLQRKYN